MKNKSSLTQKLYSKLGNAVISTSMKVGVQSASMFSFYQPKAPKNIK